RRHPHSPPRAGRNLLSARQPSVTSWWVSVTLILMKLRETLSAFDRHLLERGLRFEGIVVGGAALNLLGVIWRATKDCDILHPPLPEAIQAAARAFAAERRRLGEGLED